MRTLAAVFLLLSLTIVAACGDRVVGFAIDDTMRPSVASTTPSNGATDVSRRTPINATFSEPMDPETIGDGTFTVSRDGQPVAGAVIFFGTVAVFTPTFDLEPDAVYTATITSDATDLAGNAMADDYVWTFTRGENADTTAPLVSSTNPGLGAAGVAFNTDVTATFSEQMAPASITGDTFILMRGGTSVPGAVSYVGVTASFDPSTPLSAETTYTATLRAAATDRAGNHLAQDYVWNFTTGAAPDVTAPTISATTPAANATGVAFNAPISATFTEAMRPASISDTTFVVRDGATAIPGVVVYVGTTALFTPLGLLASSTRYIATVTTGAQDLAGNALSVNYGWEFTTGGAPDVTAPLVSATVLSGGAMGVSLNGNITATFSEAMNPQTLSSASFVLLAGTTPVAGSVSYVGVIATLDPSADLSANTTYTARIRSTVTDLAGNPLAQDYTWSFTTGAGPDVIAPTVSSTTPADDATGVAFNAPISVTFSEPMNPLTITSATFVVRDDTVTVPGTVIYLGTTAIFTPTGGLAAATHYVASVTTGAKDLAGNPLAQGHSWDFTTGSAPDISAPLVSATSPATGASGVPRNALVSATFSEPMSPLTISTATFVLLGGTTPIGGSVSYVGLTATFDPTLDLAANTTYTARIRNTVTDLAGNLLPQDYTWSFATGPASDSRRPMVSSTSPANGATGVALNTSLSAIFSEPMNPFTISGATFVLSAASVPVPGSVSYVGVTATLTPTGQLAPNTTYTGTIGVGAADLAGNSLLTNTSWTFTTGPSADTTRPRITLTSPVAGAVGAPFDSDVIAVFSEPMNPSTITGATFTLRQGTTPIAGTVTFTNLTATFDPSTALPTNTPLTATVTSAVQDLAGNALAQSYTWTFTTRAAPDTTRPLVVATTPANGMSGVALDSRVSVTFSEVMSPSSLTTATFALTHGVDPIAGTVVQSGAAAVFTPTFVLDPDTEYTATISSDVVDLAGNRIAGQYVWHFTTGAEFDADAPTIVLTSPVDRATGVARNATINATFSEPMSAPSISSATFTLTGPGQTDVAGTVSYDAWTHIASFDPLSDLLASTTYTATIHIGASDLAGTSIEFDEQWTFTTGTAANGLAPVELGMLSTFSCAAGAGLTNSNSSGTTVIDGDIALSPTGTCMGDGSPCTALNPVINGTLYQNDAGGIAAAAKAALVEAYDDAFARPPGTTIADISGMTLAPGVYTSSSTMSIAVGGTVTLDGQGDANAVWIFQIGSSLTVNNDAAVVLINGASAKNVFWAAFASSTLGSNVSFQGTVMAGASNSVGTDSVVVGRLLCITGQITLLSNDIRLPPL